jgi:channel protein (hemolysin III family)
VVATWAALPLIRLGRGSRLHRTALTVYAVCVVVLLAISGTYHSLDEGGTARTVMRRVDYFAIWLLIAGTFTAVHGVMCRGFWRRWMLTFVWFFAAVGITLQILWFRFFSGVPGLILYLGVGWIGLGSIVVLGRQIGFRAVRPMWIAGLFYSAGAILEAVRQPVIIPHWIGPHETFHLAIIVGVAIHWQFIRGLLLVHVPRIADSETVVSPSAAVAGALASAQTGGAPSAAVARIITT